MLLQLSPFRADLKNLVWRRVKLLATTTLAEAISKLVQQLPPCPLQYLQQQVAEQVIRPTPLLELLLRGGGARLDPGWVSYTELVSADITTQQTTSTDRASHNAWYPLQVVASIRAACCV